MAEFVSTFTTGFGEILRECLPRLLPGIKILALYDGLITYQFDGDPKKLEELLLFNNTFRLLLSFKAGQLTFPQMVSAAKKSNCRYSPDRGTFRVRFSNKNQFAKVDKQLAQRAEKIVCDASGLKPDRVNPQTELWYMIRSEGIGFYGQLLRKRTSTEKTLNQGELRPEFAAFMCSCTEIKPQDTICDPFCGYGAIAKQLCRHFQYKTLLCSDLDKSKIQELKKTQLAKQPGLYLSCADATNLMNTPNESVDLIITDPPWGYFEEIEDIEQFYVRMFSEFQRILIQGGKIVILSARKEELRNAALSAKFSIKNEIHTLVNGKKAAVFLLEK